MISGIFFQLAVVSVFVFVGSMALLAYKLGNFKILFTSWEIFRLWDMEKGELKSDTALLVKINKLSVLFAFILFVGYGVTVFLGV